MSSGRSRALRAILAKHQATLVIEDDHLGELASGLPHVLAGATKSWAFIRSLSKPYGPDLRCAVLAGDDETISRLEGRQWLETRWVSTILQGLAVRLWEDPAVDALIAKAARMYAGRRLAVLDELAARGVSALGRSGLNIWVPVPDETTTCARLLEAGWVVAPGRMFRVESAPGIRVTTSRLDPHEIEPLADAIAAAIHPGRHSAPPA